MGRQFADRLDRQADADQIFNRLYITALFRRGKRDGFAFLSGAACASDAVYVILSLIRKVKVDDQFNAGHVNSASGDVGCDKHPIAPGLESRERFLALGKRAV